MAIGSSEFSYRKVLGRFAEAKKQTDSINEGTIRRCYIVFTENNLLRIWIIGSIC